MTTAPTKPPARPSPAALRLSSATTQFVFLACGYVTVTSTAPMAQTSGPRPVGQRDRPLLPLISAHPWSSSVAVGSASMAAGSVTGEPNASIDRMKPIVVKRKKDCHHLSFQVISWIHKQILHVALQLAPPAALMSFSAVTAPASMGVVSATNSTTAGT